ncbi:hypothetical protein CFOL_v3_13766 [Cephalotus follicularis]|uniref:Uncharacterized protein n=1 Tax=Cephalotus follicularis TaxID=3775 RepID=A0A1Q3BQU1_CEPFO|nr:hypothetical protein CFOL_v3_13766 [Cephalotus follicularis]
MGCICSKVLSRSISYHEELNQRFHGGASDNPVLEGSGRDHFLALICTANLVVANKIQSGSSNPESNAFHESDMKDEITKTSYTWELNASIQQGQETFSRPEVLLLPPPPRKAVESIDVNLLRRSTSCQWNSEKNNEVSSLSVESYINREMALSRSFHTVEEYDAMVQKLCLSNKQQTRCEGEDHVPKHGEVNIYETHEIKKKASAAEERSVIEEIGTQSVTVTSSTSKGSSNFVEDVTHQGNAVLHRGSKRKAIAKGLESLKIPPTIEFPIVASLREGINGEGEVDSPGSYVTPKFGSYSFPFSGTENKGRSKGVTFDQELVDAFEECMQQLEAEEESILKQLSEVNEER